MGNKQNIILIGMKACGKSTTGKLLAKELNREFIELDVLCEQLHSQLKKERLDYRGIYQKHGQTYFRKLEQQALKKLFQEKPEQVVIALGGGTLTLPNNRKLVKNNGKTVFIDTDLALIIKRVQNNSLLPAFIEKQADLAKEMEIIYKKRLPIYRRLADITIPITDDSPKTVTQKIVYMLNAKRLLVNGQTKVIGFLGSTYETSKMYAMYNAAFSALGLNYVYIPFKASNIKEAIQGIKELGIRGAGVTIPFKTAAVKYLDKLDQTARKIGAVNTIVNENGTLYGYNTDGQGAIRALTEKINLQGKKVILLGNGGAAQAIAFALKKSKAELYVAGRNSKNTKILAANTKSRATALNDIKKEIANCQVLINATPVGMIPNDNQSLIDPGLLHKNLLVMDIVTKPRETKLIKNARSAGCQVIYGERMLLWQAVLKFKLFTGINPPIKIMEETIIC